MRKGEIILRPNESIPIMRRVKITRRALKHLIESRVSQKNEWIEISYLLGKIGKVIQSPQMKINNPNQSHYPKSIILATFYSDKNIAVVVVVDKNHRRVITAYFAKKSSFIKLAKIQYPDRR